MKKTKTIIYNTVAKIMYCRTDSHISTNCYHMNFISFPRLDFQLRTCLLFHYLTALLFTSGSVEGLYCKRQSNIWSLPKYWPPNPSPLVRGEDTLAWWIGGGWGFNSSEDARHCSVLYICKYFVSGSKQFC